MARGEVGGPREHRLHANVGSGGVLRVALLDAHSLTPHLDAASRANVDVLRALGALGHHARFFHALEPTDHVVAAVTDFEPDLVVLSRTTATIAVSGALRDLRCPQIYLGHELAQLRLAAEHEVRGGSPLQARVMAAVERRCWELTDLWLYPDEHEASFVTQAMGREGAHFFPYFVFGDEPVAPLRQRTPWSLVFVGPGASAQNIDAIEWFVSSVVPTLMARHPEAVLTIVGQWGEDDVVRLSRPGVHFAGVVDEDELSQVLATSSVAIAPLRFGSGVKRKVLQYLSAGIPAVVSAPAAAGISWSDQRPPFLIADEPDSWLAALELVATEPQVRQDLVDAGREVVTSTYSATGFEARLRDILLLAFITPHAS